MQHAHGPLSEQPRGDAPLPPARTYHIPAVAPLDSETLAAPFIPGRDQHSVPAPSAPEPLAAAPIPAEEPMPWEIEPATDQAAWPGESPPVPDDEPWGAAQAPLAPAEEPWAQEPAPAAAIEPEPWPAPQEPFPLDAFIRPEAPAEDAQRAVADAAADRLEALAARLRAEGFAALLQPGADARQIDLLLASLLSGYVAR